MDERAYAAVAEVCARLAGRLSDDTLDAARGFYAAGEWYLADGTLLLSLAYEAVGITREERDLIRSFLGDPDDPGLPDVPVITEVPPPPYRFSPTGPTDAPDPTRADQLLASEAVRRGGHSLHRAWREPSTWLYLLRMPAGTDELKTGSGLTAELWTRLQERWQIEVVVEGTPLTPYRAAAAAAARQVPIP